jgi:pimeloyl-ACP methyl ester carboxylesterase
MDAASPKILKTACSFAGYGGLKLVGDLVEPGGVVRGTAILLHGGGQTRHSWARTANDLANNGWRVVSVDQRGHGSSEWDAEGDYSMSAYGRDLAALGTAMAERWRAPVVVVGASLGGIAGMLAAGEYAPEQFRALVLVDITPELKHDGVERILGFMAANAEHGFSSLDEAADAIAEYLPHRPRPRDSSGLAKNLTLGEDGRYRWHWDPRFLDSRREAREHVGEVTATLVQATKHLELPVLLVRGRESELVGEGEAARFVELVPHARVADVSGARHMVAGDRNDVFSAAVCGFLADLAG